MKKIDGALHQKQEKVNAFFQSGSLFWKDIYSSRSVFAEIHRDRHAAVLKWIDDLSLTPGTRVLEVGCGAGFMAIALAQRGFRIHAIDSVEEMVEQARRHAVETGATEMLSLDVGNVYSLAFDDNAFDLVVALGVIPWLERPDLAIQEMARVTGPGGHVILTADNPMRLNVLLDPLLNPSLAPLKRYMRNVLEGISLRRKSSDEVEVFNHFHDRHFIDETLSNAELFKIRDMMLGFGPFSLFRHKVLPESISIALHHRLQDLANRNMPGLRSTGSHYLVLARKSASRPLMQSTDNEISISDALEAL